MTTRVKIAIAAVIIAALVVLIVLDRNTASTKDDGSAAQEESIFPDVGESSGGDAPARREETTRGSGETAPRPQPASMVEEIWNIDSEDLEEYTRKLREQGPLFGSPSEAIKDAAPGGSEKDEIKGTERRPVEVPSPPARNDVYVVEPGDSYYKIAKKKYGDGNLWKVIQDANPDVKPYSLRVGRKIALPPKPVRAASREAVVEEAGRKVYVVQPGDTLTGISYKLFNTIKYAADIFDANHKSLSGPDDLVVGQKLTLPDATPVAKSAPKESDPVPAGARVHTVEQGDSLWKIAERYRKNQGILEMMDRIVASNVGRLSSKNTPLRVGWTLVIPD